MVHSIIPRFYLNTPIYIVISLCIILSLIVTVDVNAQQKPSTLSGRVIDTQGIPIHEVLVSYNTWRTKTDTEGLFTITNIPQNINEMTVHYLSSVEIGAKYYNTAKMQSIKFGKLTEAFNCRY